jgi:hypothetical protein
LDKITLLTEILSSKIQHVLGNILSLHNGDKAIANNIPNPLKPK